MQKVTKASNGIASAMSSSQSSREVVLPRSWLTCLSLLLLIIVLGLVSLAAYAVSLRNDLRMVLQSGF